MINPCPEAHFPGLLTISLFGVLVANGKPLHFSTAALLQILNISFLDLRMQFARPFSVLPVPYGEQ
jgi:hypothetical protein